MDLDFAISEYTLLWMLVCVALVFFMQGGFAMVETGLTRAKNAGNIIMKNLMDFCLGTAAFWLLGYSLLLGDSVGGFIGRFVNPIGGFMTSFDLPWFMFNLVFCATAATIVSGAMAERTKFSAYCLYSIAISAVIYPIEAHWIWNSGGWLFNLGFQDFAGSTAVHMVGGLAALFGAAILGPRTGKYTADGKGGKKANAIPGHSLTLAALGVFILWFCWYGFNGAAATSAWDAARIFGTTTIAAAFAAIGTMCFTWLKNGKPDVSMTLNGALAGLVAITAGCAYVDALGASLIGLAAGIVVVLAVEFIDQKIRVDDPVGAISVHGVCGALGTILVGLFDVERGLFYGGGTHLLGVQALGVFSVMAWVAVTMSIVFFIIKKTIGLRVSVKDEIDGLDISEHNLASSYADFMFVGMPDIVPASTRLPVTGSADVDKAVPVFVDMTSSKPNAKMSRVEIIMNQNRFEALKDELERIEVTGMTVTNVLGCGTQKGAKQYYRGLQVGIQLLPKLKVEVVVSKVPVGDVIAAARRALYTGNIGDGKIFVTDVENVVRVRTGEVGYDALQCEEA
jgi:Amt family ammonium transporter